jgi:hypothetical protein
VQADDLDAAEEALKPAWEALREGKHKKLNGLDCSLEVSPMIPPAPGGSPGFVSLKHMGVVQSAR